MTVPDTVVSVVRRVWRDRPGHQRAAHPVVERDARTAVRHGLGRVGQLSGQLLGSPLGSRHAESGRVPRARALHDRRASSYPVCTANGNLNHRRELFLENPPKAQYIANLDSCSRRRLDRLSRPEAVVPASFGCRREPQRQLHAVALLRSRLGEHRRHRRRLSTNPDNPDADRGHCDADRTHLANFTVGYQTPQVDNAALQALASNWRVSGIVNARSGSWLTVATGRQLVQRRRRHSRLASTRSPTTSTATRR